MAFDNKSIIVDDIPLSKEAQKLFERLQPRIEDRLAEVNSMPVSALLWGPGLTSECALSECRYDLRKNLRKQGHAAFFSEELCNSKDSIRLQQLVQAQEFDIIISMPGTPGSIGEIHDFTADRRVNAKILVFLNDEYKNGYSNQSIEAISTIASCKIHYYQNLSNLNIIHEISCNEIQKMRELKYILTGRY